MFTPEFLAKLPPWLSRELHIPPWVKPAAKATAKWLGNAFDVLFCAFVATMTLLFLCWAGMAVINHINKNNDK